MGPAVVNGLAVPGCCCCPLRLREPAPVSLLSFLARFLWVFSRRPWPPFLLFCPVMTPSVGRISRCTGSTRASFGPRPKEGVARRLGRGRKEAWRLGHLEATSEQQPLQRTTRHGYRAAWGPRQFSRTFPPSTSQGTSDVLFITPPSDPGSWRANSPSQALRAALRTAPSVPDCVPLGLVLTAKCRLGDLG